MVAYRESDGLEKLATIIASVLHEMRVEKFRNRVQAFNVAFFGSIFAALVVIETTLAAVMFEVMHLEIMGSAVSGAAYALLVPIVIGAVHVKVHHEGDHFTKWWLKKLSSIGILLFALGVSIMVGFSAWQAAREAISIISTGPVGMIGSQQVQNPQAASNGIADWIAPIPQGLLFLGLSFGMIITIYFASFCLGKALQAFNILTIMPRIGKGVKAVIEALKGKIAAFRMLRDEDVAANWKRPFDLKHKFAREVFNACWKISQAKLTAARRKFDPARLNDPLAVTFRDVEAETIPNHFKNEEAFCRHLADEMDGMRIHNVLRVLTGITENGEKNETDK